MNNPFTDEYGLSGFGIICSCVLATVVLVGAILFGVNVATHAACRQEGHTMHLATKYHAMSGCYLNVKGQWVPDSAYMNNQGN